MEEKEEMAQTLRLLRKAAYDLSRTAQELVDQSEGAVSEQARQCAMLSSRLLGYTEDYARLLKAMVEVEVRGSRPLKGA